jgi:hypothetical protein
MAGSSHKAEMRKNLRCPRGMRVPYFSGIDLTAFWESTISTFLVVHVFQSGHKPVFRHVALFLPHQEWPLLRLR